MKIAVLFFGVLKDLTGQPGETLDLPQGTQVQGLLSHYVRKFPKFERMSASLAVSVNREYSGADRTLHEGDEVGLLPPVSGGSARGGEGSKEEAQETSYIRIVRERIHPEAIVAKLKQPSDGAVVVFDGIVRDNTRGRRTLYLDYESYEPMAQQQMEALVEDARKRFAVREVTVVHRLGRLEIGETSVLVAVAAAHRGPAFEACRWIIDTLKKTIPIWKKEVFEDGAEWAAGEPFPEEIRSSESAIDKRPASN